MLETCIKMIMIKYASIFNGTLRLENEILFNYNNGKDILYTFVDL